MKVLLVLIFIISVLQTKAQVAIIDSPTFTLMHQKHSLVFSDAFFQPQPFFAYSFPSPPPQPFSISDNQVNQINQRLSGNCKSNIQAITNQLEKSHSIFPQPQPSPQPLPVFNHSPGMFCKMEYKIESKSKFAPRFRLGSLNYTNWMEGKGELYSRYWK